MLGQRAQPALVAGVDAQVRVAELDAVAALDVELAEELDRRDAALAGVVVAARRDLDEVR